MPILDNLVDILPNPNNDPNASTPPSPPPPSPPHMEAAAVAVPQPPRLLAVIDMGTNSFKLLLARAHPNGRLLPLDRLKEPVLLGRGRAPDGSLYPDTQLRALAALRTFSLALRSHSISGVRVVATAAVRDAPNRAELLSSALNDLGLEVDVISGEEEARLIYRGVLQFLPLYAKCLLAIDIGGGSTEFVIGHKGEVLFAASLQLGHVSLTESFIRKDKWDHLRQHVRTVLHGLPVVGRIRDLGFEVAVGSSGTVRSIERAIFLSSVGDLVSGEFNREWRFTREELGLLVDKLSGLGSTVVDGARRLGFSKRRAEFIVAGAILLSEIFDALGIAVMEVSGYALGEGVVSEMLARDSTGYDMEANARWRSVLGLATRFDGENRMKSAVGCVSVAKEIFDAIRKSHELGGYKSRCAACLDEKDLEYLEAAILLHNIGLLFGQKGYHKRSYKIIKNGAHLCGYSPEEIELVALLARFHRKKFPRRGHASLSSFSAEMKLKFRALCVIIRVSYALQHCQYLTFQGLEVSFSNEGFRLVLGRLKDQQLVHHDLKQTSATVDADLQPELEHFEEVFQQKLLISFLDTC